jgi:hypothetical protein
MTNLAIATSIEVLNKPHKNDKNYLYFFEKIYFHVD